MNADKKSPEAAAAKTPGGGGSANNSPAKGKAKPDKAASGDEEEVENGSGDAGKDTKNGDTASKKPEGPMALGEIAYIDSKITSTKIDGLQPLYNICFDVAGKTQTLKKNLRTFKGFSFKEDSPEFTKKVDAAQKLDIKVLKSICDILDVDKKGTNKEIAERICQFLVCPEGEPEPSEDEEEEGEEEEEEEESEEEKPKKRGAPPAKKGGATGGRPRRSTAGRNFNHEDFLSSEESDEEEPKPKGKRKRGDTDSGSDYNPSGASDSDAGKKKRATGTRRSARYQSNSEDDDDDYMSSDEESDVPKRKRGAPARRAPARGRGKKKETESEESEPEDDSEDSDAPKKKKATPAKKKASPAKGRGRPKRTATGKKKARDQTTSEEEDEEEEVDDDLEHLQEKGSDSEDEPLAKKPKAGFPTDDDIKGYVKKILDEANLEEITMKTVCKEVYAQYPGHDLTHKKDFIKATVKSLIAT